MEESGGHPRAVADRRHVRGAHLLTQLVPSSLKTRSSPHLRTGSSQVYTADFTGLVTSYHPNGLNNAYSLKAPSLKTAPTVATLGSIHSKDREAGEEPPIARIQLSGQPTVTSSP